MSNKAKFTKHLQQTTGWVPSQTLKKMTTDGHLQAAVREDSLNGTDDHLQAEDSQMLKGLTNLAQDVGTGQVEGRPVVAALYWTVTIVFAVCVFAVTQAIGGVWDDQDDETSFPAKVRATPAHALRTHEEYYVPSPEVSPTGWLSDQGFLRYSTLVLTLILTLALTLTLTL